MVLAVAGFWNPLLWFVLVAGGVTHVYRSGLRLYLSVKPEFPELWVFLFVPAILITRDAAQLAGHLVGYYTWLSNSDYKRKYIEYMTLDSLTFR